MKKWFFIILVPLVVSGSISLAESTMVWHKEYVDKGGWNNIVLDNNGVPHISYCSNQDLKYAVKIGETWMIDIVDSIGNFGVGEYNSIKLDSEGNPHISYYDNTNDNLKYAKKDSFWVIEEVDTIGNVGRYSSLFLDSLDRPCIAYCDFTQKTLKYAKKDGGIWEIQVVDSGIDTCEISYSSLTLDTGDNPHIAYVFQHKQVSTFFILKYAYRDKSKWQMETADSNTYSVDCWWMGYVTLALDNFNIPYISYSKTDEGTVDDWTSANCIVRDSSGWQNIWWEETIYFGCTLASVATLSQTNDSVPVHIIRSGEKWMEHPPYTKYIRIGESDTITTWVDSVRYDIYPRCIVLDSENYPHGTFGGVYYWYGEDVEVEESEELKAESVKLKVYPNPFTSHIAIKLFSHQAIREKVKVYDMMGRLVEERSGKREARIGKNLPAGVYFVKIKGYNPVKIIKLMEVL